jgi:GNAT superfamily N-acetyltransferase
MNGASEPRLRVLQAGDAVSAYKLSLEAGWNQTIQDWSMLIELSPDGCLGIDVDGDLVSTGTLFCYGRRLAWVGMVLTKVAFRGRGFARRILTELLRLADRKAIETVKLDATDQGQPLYEKLGFRIEQAVERWIRPGEKGARLKSNDAPQDLPPGWHNLDTTAFGTDRTFLIERLARRRAPIVEKNCFALSRTGRENNFLGPCVASSSDMARGLIQSSLLAAQQGGWLWDLFVENKNATALATDLGFAPQRHLMRMVRGNDLRGNEASVFALAGFELG